MTRKTLRARRRALPASLRRQAAADLTRNMMTSLRFLRARNLAFYMASDGEIDVLPLMMAALDAGKTCFLPVMVDRLQRFRRSPLVFQRFENKEQVLVRNRWGLLEPPLDARHQIAPQMLDLIIMPLVGFDRQGNRLGMGKGYFDRALSRLRTAYRRPTLVGAAFSFQEVADITPQPWDIPLDGIVTEKSLCWVEGQEE
ncbi:MAG: 5-formyltetrahydrofolate cyclo-ligase [Pseudomonadota bacterium]